MGLTSVFGYETYVPKLEDVQEAAIYNYYYQSEKPFIDTEDVKELNEYIITVHKDFVENKNRSILNHEYYHDTRIHIEYKLKNGRIIRRRYGVDNITNSTIMNKVYEYPEYKYACEEVFSDDIERITSISVGTHAIAESSYELNELLECIKKDVDILGYDEIHSGRGVSCYIHYITKENVTTDDGRYIDDTNWMDLYITEHYENTLNWLEEYGYSQAISKLR